MIGAAGGTAAAGVAHQGTGDGRDAGDRVGGRRRRGDRAVRARGLVESTRVGYRVTDAGRERVEQVYAAEREQAEAVVLDVYETFLPINDEVKQIVTDWQMRVVDGQIVLNDHSDRSHDEDVIARLQEIDAKVAPAAGLTGHGAAPLRPVCPPPAQGARRDPRRRPDDGRRADQGQLPHGVVRAPRGPADAVRPASARSSPPGSRRLSGPESAGPPTRFRRDRGTR